MAATYSAQLTSLLREFMDSGRPTDHALKQELQSTAADAKYKLLMEERSVHGESGIDRAAYERDLEGLICMLSELTPEQKYEVMKLTTIGGETPLRAALHNKGSYSTSTPPKDIVEYLLKDLSVAQKFYLLKQQNRRGNTALSKAAFNNYTDCIQLIMSQLDQQQQQYLWHLKDADGYFPIDHCGPTLQGAVQGLRDSQKEVEIQEKDIATQKEEIASQKNEIAIQRQEIVDQKENIANLNRQIAERKEGQLMLAEKCIRQEHQIRQLQETQQQMTDQQQQAMQVMTERQQAMEKMLEQLQIELRRPIVTDETGDQELEELEELEHY